MLFIGLLKNRSKRIGQKVCDLDLLLLDSQVVGFYLIAYQSSLVIDHR